MNYDLESSNRLSINRAKRAWRARNPRIDYYPSKEALAIIKGKYGPYSRCNNYSGILDAIVREWAEDRNLLERSSKVYGSGKRPEFSDTYARANDFGGSQKKHVVLLEENLQVICGATTQSGRPCRAKSLPNKKRCKWHGGCSTGPKTDEGKSKALANLKQYRRLAVLAQI